MEPGFYPQVQPVRLTVSMIICAREIKKDWNYGHRFGTKIDDLQAPLFTYDLGATGQSPPRSIAPPRSEAPLVLVTPVKRPPPG